MRTGDKMRLVQDVTAGMMFGSDDPEILGHSGRIVTLSALVPNRLAAPGPVLVLLERSGVHLWVKPEWLEPLAEDRNPYPADSGDDFRYIVTYQDIDGGFNIWTPLVAVDENGNEEALYTYRERDKAIAAAAQISSDDPSNYAYAVFRVEYDSDEYNDFDGITDFWELVCLVWDGSICDVRP